jgi:7-carboxy-7-deazaguanine synthase
MRIHSHFLSIDGEVNFMGQGIPSIFLRLQGCNIRPFCSYCDVPEAQDPKGGQEMSVQEVFDIIRGYECPKITITGGEPLLQDKEIHKLLNRLFPYKYKISIETNGTISTARFRECRKPDPDVALVVDYKFSGHNPEAFKYLREWDWVKVVVAGRDDFEAARDVLKWSRACGSKARFALSPVHGVLPGKVLAEWILDAKMWDVTLNCQIHKFLSLP